MVTMGKPRVLVVDDEEEIRGMLSRHFRFLGYDVLTAANGKEALRLLCKNRTEVVVSDIKMPVMDGIELLKEVKTQYPMIHVVIITGHVTLDNLLAAFRRGADTCVFKPLNDLAELETAVANAVGHLKTWQRKLKELREIKDA